MERQIRWEVESSPNPEMHNYNILIINSRTEARKIQQRLNEQFNPIIDLTTLQNALIRGTKLRYLLITFQAPRKPPELIDWKKIYKGKVKRDRNLYTRHASDGLISYIDTQMLEGAFS